MYFDADDSIRKDMQDGFIMKVDCVAEFLRECYEVGFIEGYLISIFKYYIEYLIKNELEMDDDSINEYESAIDEIVDDLFVGVIDFKSMSYFVNLTEDYVHKILDRD